MKALVTGAGGFVGSHLAEELVRRGHSVTALVHYRGDGRAGWLEESPLRGEMAILRGDVRDGDQMRALTDGHDVIFHLAALIGIPYSYGASRSYVETNVVGTLNILQGAWGGGVERVIVTSTSEVYGSAIRVPQDEDHPLNPQSPYAASKVAADALALSFHRSFGLPVTIVRPFNVYGPRQSSRAVIPTIIGQVASAHGIVRLGNLETRRDFTYVSDTVDGFIKAAETPAAVGEVVNLGTGSEISVHRLAIRIGYAMGTTFAIARDVARERPPASEVDRLCADASKARALLGWAPKAGLEDGLRETIAWMRERPNLWRQDYAV